MNLARYTLYQKTAPLIQAIVSTDRSPGLGGIFKPFMPETRAWAATGEGGKEAERKGGKE
jgi:hypothetical protein